MSSVSIVFLIFLASVINVINGQASQQLYSFDFATRPGGWTVGGAGVDTSTNCPAVWNGGKCWYMGKGIAYASRTYSVFDHHDITVFIDIRSWDNEPDEYCNVRYQTGVSGGWQTLYNFPGNNAEQIRTNIELFLPPSVDNRADFQIQVYSDHTGDFDWCNYDNLEIWGIPYTTVTTAAPVSAVTEQPTTNVPTTTNPTTFVPTTNAPTTSVPTANPTTANPTTYVPTTNNPTTSNPTTLIPTTSIPTTLYPTTLSPSTSIPTTSVPTTSVPTISTPTTSQNGGEVVELSTSTKSGNEDMEAGNKQDDMIWLYVCIAIGCVSGIIIWLICMFKRRMKDAVMQNNVAMVVNNKTNNIELELTDFNDTKTQTNVSYVTSTTEIGVESGEFQEGYHDATDTGTDDDGLYEVQVGEDETAGNDLYANETAGNDQTKGNETAGAFNVTMN